MTVKEGDQERVGLFEDGADSAAIGGPPMRIGGTQIPLGSQVPVGQASRTRPRDALWLTGHRAQVGEVGVRGVHAGAPGKQQRRPDSSKIKTGNRREGRPETAVPSSL